MDEQSTKKRGFAWMKLVLAVSLALNLLVIGLAVGAALRFGNDVKMRLGGPTMGANLVRTLPKADRRAVFAELRGASISPKKQRRAEAEALTEALRRSPFDPDAVNAVLEQQAQERNEWVGEARRVWLSRVTMMEDAQRRDYADRLFKALTRPRHGKPSRKEP